MGPGVAYEWSDLVTTALLGTDRRRVPDLDDSGITDPGPGSLPVDPVAAVLDRAAAHRVAVQAATALPSCPAPFSAPTERPPEAPEAAQVLLGELLSRPQPALVNLWLATCAEAGLGAALEHWSRLAELAARSTGYDRQLLRQVLGPRGTWLLAQNPRWARLASAGETSEGGAPQHLPSPGGAAAVLLLQEQVLAVQAQIEGAFSRTGDRSTAHPEPNATQEDLR